jgi:hypothetical protein
VTPSPEGQFFVSATPISRRVAVWKLRAVWATLPLTAGAAADGGLDGWSRAPALVAVILLWATWGLVLLGTLSPRPPALTALRIVAPTYLALAVIIAVAGDASSVASAFAIGATALATVLAIWPDISVAFACGVAYGDELRIPLKVPPGVAATALPLAPFLIATGIAAGPLLLADERWVAGVVGVVIGLPVAALLTRSIHGLSRRWVVLVPAGVVIVDPLTLPDPVLFTRDSIRSLRAVDAREPDGPDTLDLRLGAISGAVAVTLARPTEFLATRRGLRGSQPAKSTELRVAVVHRAELLTNAAARRIPVLLD